VEDAKDGLNYARSVSAVNFLRSLGGLFSHSSKDLLHLYSETSVQASFLSSPVQFAQDPNPRRIFLGEMKTSLIGIDLDTGAVIGDFGNPPGGPVSVGTPLASCGPVPHARGRDLREGDMLELLDEMEADHESVSFRKDGCGSLLYLTRTGAYSQF
jgi:hypothetical protein